MRKTNTLSDAASARVFDRLVARAVEHASLTPLALREALKPEDPGMGWGHYVPGFCAYLNERAAKDSRAVWILARLACAWGEAFAEVRKAEIDRRDAARLLAYRLDLPWPVYSEGPGDTIECPETGA